MKNIYFVNPHNNLCGGNKIIFEYCNLLAEKYQKCFVICDDLVPNWMPINAFFLDRKTALKIMKPKDIIVFHWDFDANYVLKAPAKNKYCLVQHFIHLKDKKFKMPFKFLAVSSYIQKHNKETYNVDSELLLNSIDHNIFYNQKLKRKQNNIFAIDRGAWKDVNTIKKAETILQNPEIKFIYKDNLTPKEIAKEYNLADIYISASWYEGFGLPVLEAMACGAVVITTDSKGIDDFAKDNFNCLIVPPKQPTAIAEAIKKLINDSCLKEKLRINGLATTKKFSWQKTIDKLAKIFNLTDYIADEDIKNNISSGFKTIKNEKHTLGKQFNLEKRPILKFLHLYQIGKPLVKTLDKIGFKCGNFDYQKIHILNKKTIYLP